MKKQTIWSWIALDLVLLYLTSAEGVMNKTKSERELKNLNSLEIVENKNKTGKDGDKAATFLANNYVKIPLNRGFIGGHSRFGLGTSLRVGGLNRGEVRPGGDSYGASTNFPSPGFDHSGSGVHVSGNGYSYGRPGYQDEQPPPFPGVGERGPSGTSGYANGFGHSGYGPPDLVYQGQTGGGRPPLPDRPPLGGHLTPPIGGHPPIGGLPPGDGYPPGPGGPIGPGGHGGPGGPYPVGPQGGGIGSYHKLALKKLLIPIAGVAVLGAAAALASANPILLQLGVAGKRRRRHIKSRRNKFN